MAIHTICVYVNITFRLRCKCIHVALYYVMTQFTFDYLKGHAYVIEERGYIQGYANRNNGYMVGTTVLKDSGQHK